jgi:hypothetical protein
MREHLPVITTVTIDHELYQRALDLADPGMEKSELSREAIKVFGRVQAAKRLSALGGGSPKMKSIGPVHRGGRLADSSVCVAQWRPTAQLQHLIKQL